MKPDDVAAHIQNEVKRRDPARFVATLFAPEAERRALLALYALDGELRHIPEAAREAMIAAMRYQWWRDAVARLPEPSRGHPVLDALSAAVSAGTLDTVSLVGIVDAREAGAGESEVITAAARVLGAAVGANALATAAAAALETGDRAKLAEARLLWRAERRARKGELPAYLPATYIDAKHPVTQTRLYGRALWMAMRNRF